MRGNRLFVVLFNALPLCGLLVLVGAHVRARADIPSAKLRQDIAATVPIWRPALVRSAHQMAQVAVQFSDKPYGTYTHGYGYRRRHVDVDYRRR